MTAVYKHTQKGHYLLVFALLAGTFTVAISHYFILENAPLRNAEETTAYWVTAASGLLTGLVLVWAAALVSALTVKIEDGSLTLRFGPGAYSKKFALDRITHAQTVRNKWFFGWGIRFIGNGWLYNVSGLDAVEIILQNGKRRRIGTDEPQLLAAAINNSLTGE
jgi:hypothetical protein